MSRIFQPTPIPHEPSFVGRVRHLQAVADLFDEGVRIVTLVGPGGIGKTTLAARFAAETRVFLSVVFVPLAEVQSADGLAMAVGSTLNIEFEAGEDPLARVAKALANLDSPLLILDNVEQILELASDTVMMWLRVAPKLRVLVTSRIPLHIRPERAVDLGPLDPDDAFMLFRRLARSNADELATRELLERLDRLPLAIVLAASVSHVMPPGQMLDRFDVSLEILKSRDPHIEERHASLIKAIEWSWDLLSPEKQELLVGLTAFRGGFTVESVVEVLRPDSSFIDTLEALTELIDASMVIRVGQGAPARFDLMHSIRAYLSRKANLSYDVIHRHADWHVTQAEERLEKRMSRSRPRVVEELLEDLDNLMAAYERTDGALHARVGVAAARTLAELGSAERLEKFLDDLNNAILRTDLKLQKLLVEAQLRYERLQLGQAQNAIIEGLAIARKLKNHAAETMFHVEQAKLELRRENFEAAETASLEAIEASQRSDELVARIEARRWRAKVDYERGLLTQARHGLEAVLSIAQTADVPLLVGRILANLADIDQDCGQHASEERRLEQARTIFKSLKARQMRAGCEYRLGCLLRRQHRHEEALELLSDAVTTSKRLGFREGIPFSLIELGTCLHQLRDFEGARRALEEALENTPRDFLTFARGALGVLSLEERRYGAAREYLRSLLDDAHRLGQHRFDEVSRTALAIVAWEEGSLVEAEAFLEAVLASVDDHPFDGRRPDGRRHIPLAYALLGALQAQSGQLDRAQQSFDRAAELASADDFRDIPSAVLVLEGFVDLAQGAQDRAQARLEAARDADWREHSIETRICARLLQDAMSIPASNNQPRLVVHPEGDYFRLADGDVIDISRRKAHRYILAAMARARAAGSEKSFDVHDLFEIGWPGERVAPDVGARRVYTTVRELRSMGLETVLVTHGEGYVLDGVSVSLQ